MNLYHRRKDPYLLILNALSPFLRLFLTSLLIDSYGVRLSAAFGLLPYILIFLRCHYQIYLIFFLKLVIF